MTHNQLVPTRAIAMTRDGCGMPDFVATLRSWALDSNCNKRKPGEPYLPFRPLDIIACGLRPCLTGKPGPLILAEFSSVEARGVAWLFNAERPLRVFRRGETEIELVQGTGVEDHECWAEARTRTLSPFIEGVLRRC